MTHLHPSKIIYERGMYHLAKQLEHKPWVRLDTLLLHLDDYLPEYTPTPNGLLPNPSQCKFTRPSMSGTSGTAKCPEPLCPRQVLPLAAWRLAPHRRALPLLLRSSLLRTHPPILIPPSASRHPLGQWVFAGCCQPPSAGPWSFGPGTKGSGQALLGVGPSRRYLCESFPTCLSSLGPVLRPHLSWTDRYRVQDQEPGPLPRLLLRCLCPFLPSKHRTGPPWVLWPQDKGYGTVLRPSPR